MRIFALLLIMTCTILLSVACGSSEQPTSSTGSAQATPTATVRTPAQSVAQLATPSDAPPVAIAHGAPPPNQTVPPPGNSTSQPGNSAPPSSGSSGPDTAALDKKVEKAELKAKAPKATQADKMAAAAAYLERANVFYNAGNPTLYKFALRDFRRTLRYNPSNEEARAKQQQIVEIYQSMGRPVPDLGNEQ